MNNSSVDWFQVITDLSKLGYTLHSIAIAIGVAKSTLIGWKQGAEPKYQDGERLVALWSRITESDRDRLPRLNPFEWR